MGSFHYLSQTTIRFFLDNNLQFRIIDSSDLVQLLKGLEHLGELSKGLLKRIIKFETEKFSRIYKWDEKIFEKFLQEQRGYYTIPQEEYDKFIKLIE